MSYSISAKAATKAEAVAAIKTKLDEVVAQQPVHAQDRALAASAAEAFANVLPDDDKADVSLNVSGSIYVTEGGIRQVSCNVSASLVQKEPTA